MLGLTREHTPTCDCGSGGPESMRVTYDHLCYRPSVSQESWPWSCELVPQGGQGRRAASSSCLIHGVGRLVSRAYLRPFLFVLGRASPHHPRPAPGGGLWFPGHSEERLWQTLALLASFTQEHLSHDVRKVTILICKHKCFAFSQFAKSCHFP